MTNDLMLEVIEGRIPMPGKPKPLTLSEGIQAFQAILDIVDDVARKQWDACRRAYETLQDAGVIATPPPTDPRERALWATQHRNTGPATGPLRDTGRNNHYKTKR